MVNPLAALIAEALPSHNPAGVDVVGPGISTLHAAQVMLDRLAELLAGEPLKLLQVVDGQAVIVDAEQALASVYNAELLPNGLAIIADGPTKFRCVTLWEALERYFHTKHLEADRRSGRTLPCPCPAHVTVVR